MKELFDKILILFESMNKVKKINDLFYKSIIDVVIIYISIIIYLFALNGRYKPLGNSEYGLYKDVWTGKVHSAFVEYAKNTAQNGN